MGRHITNNTAALHEPLTVTTTGDAVISGDYVRAEASGLGRRAVDGLALGLQNTAAGVTAIASLGVTAHMPVAGYGIPNTGRTLAVLGNGNVACLYAGNGATPSTGLTCAVYSPIKALVVTINVSSAALIQAARVHKVGPNNFAVIWSENTTLKMAVYTNAGAVVLAAITIATTSASGSTYWHAATLVNGDLVVAYEKTAAGGVFFSRYNSSGVLQGAETTVEASTAGNYFCVLALAAGGFLVYYYRATSTTAYRFARYNAAGVLQGALTTVFTGSATLSGGMQDNYAAELSNGSFALVDPSVGTVSAVRLYDSAGTFLLTVTNVTGLAAGAGPSNTMLRAKSGGGLYIAVFSGPLALYDNVGTRLFSVAAPNLLASSNFGLLIDRPNLGPVLYAGQDNSGTGAVTAYAYTSALVLEATALTVQVGASPVGLWAEVMPSGMLAYAFGSSAITGVAAHGRLWPQAASVLGLAVTAGTDGQAVTVATAGRWTANQSFVPANFDRRSSDPVGCKAVITGGTQAVLLGIVA